ncbi:MAG: ATP-binding protein [Gemmatimonas sp.]
MTSGDGPVSVTIVRREWTISSNIVHIEPLVSEVVSLCLEAGLSARACRLNIPVAFTEALSNAIVCGNHENEQRNVIAKFELDASFLTLEITDDGNGFDAATVNFSPEDGDWLEREDGRGLFLMRSLMDRVESERPGRGHVGHTVRLILNRA